MNIRACLENTGPSRIAVGLREVEDYITSQVKGDIYTVQSAYRWSSRYIRENLKVPEFKDLPKKIARRIPHRDWSKMRELISEQIEIIGTPCIRSVIEIKYDDVDKERERRAALYEQQWTEIEARFGDDHKISRESFGSLARSVWTIRRIPLEHDLSELPLFPGIPLSLFANHNNTEVLSHESIKDAAKYITETTGINTTRNAVGTAISRQGEIHGVKVGYCDWKPSPRSNATPVRCDDHDFPSQSAAAEFFGVSQSSIYDGIKDGSPVSGRIFRTIDRQDMDPNRYGPTLWDTYSTATP